VKVAFLNKYQNKANRGAEVFVTEVSNRLRSQFEVDVISDIDYLKILNTKYDVIVPTNGRSQVFIVRIISWLSGAKMIISGQSGLGADDKWNLLCRPEVFVALTHFQESWAKRFKPGTRTAVIPNGVDLKVFNSKIVPMQINLAKPIILSVGAFENGKRLDLIIKAVAKTKASLLLVGKGDKQNELQELGDKLLPGRFKIMSFPHSKMPKVYMSANMFTYPTVPWESFGIVIVEAMASGLPIVATNDPIRKEIIGSAGILVNPVDAEKYAVAIQNALDKKWGNIPRSQSRQFDWDDIAKKYAELFRSL
jgi:glycosyltransferase involved in cell wall biosynthesis